LPELPEVETTRRGIKPSVKDNRIYKITVRQKKLRWLVPDNLPFMLEGYEIRQVSRRGKYLLFENEMGTMLIHLGMSGSLRIVKQGELPKKHDHIDFCFKNGLILRFTDPRKFGCVLWQTKGQGIHPLLANLGPEPLNPNFNSKHLFLRSRKRSVCVKPFIMDSKVVVGVGNIYASEALFLAGISPKVPAGKVSQKRYQRLVSSIKIVLKKAIQSGGTTLRDFTDGNGNPGYFKQSLNVYGRAGKECKLCRKHLIEIRQAQRSTVYCSACQR
jgi:formamidopyrimidine-DNA glycosylase